MSSSPNNNSAAAVDANGNGDEKPRLTEEEKKQNHIASAARHLDPSTNSASLQSEQKRRQAIREGFDRLTELVPGLEGQGRSEGLVLKKTVEYMRQQLDERQAMIERVEQTGGAVDPELKSSAFAHPHNRGRAER
ncbi:hypothetical protein NLG97_g6488 [Lecanicillium saksenae]|uniref:Uncharacterized protein n=1 Tax=Lecanicillium saksenae TaxID=468837 RepID=A0ACC1QRT8_9HYPO|nr:hypothetical protein NLG97_g6488 [Lecanicillium saksenae]